MKGLVLAVCLFFALTVPAFAQVDIDGPKTSGALSPIGGANAQSGATASANSSANAGVVNNIGNGFGNFSPRLDFDYRSFDFQNQFQGQGQGQGQFGYVAPVQEVTVTTPRELLPIPEIPAQINPLVQGGVGIYAHLPKLKIKRIAAEETVVRVVDSFNGWFMDRICVEDVTAFVLKKGNKLISDKAVAVAKLRYQVYYKSKAKGVGVSGGLNAAGSALNGGGSSYGGGGGGQVTPGYNSSWADPPLTVEFYEIE